MALSGFNNFISHPFLRIFKVKDFLGIFSGRNGVLLSYEAPSDSVR